MQDQILVIEIILIKNDLNNLGKWKKGTVNQKQTFMEESYSYELFLLISWEKHSALKNCIDKEKIDVPNW